MNVQMSLLSLAVVSGLAMSAPAEAAGNQKSAAIARANALIAGPAAASVRRAGADGFVARDVVVDADGTEHVRFERTYQGLPVIGGDFVLQSRNGKVGKVSQTLKTSARPGLAGRIGADQAIVEAGARFGSTFIGAPTSRKVVYALGASPVLAHEVVFNGVKADQTPTVMHYIVDAANGKVLNQWDEIHTARPGPGGSSCAGTAAAATGASLMVGSVALTTTKCSATSYEMRDPTRGGGYVTNMAMKTSGNGTVFTDSDNAWGNGLTSNSQTVAVDAQFGIAKTWDYFLTVHGRNGIAGDGRGSFSRVHYGRNYANAFWSDSCFCMTFGDGDNGASIYPLVSIDVAGHEMSHGVTSRTANLIYNGESGSLNEATSDIFGTMVEYYANTAADPADYVMGEELYPNNANMSNAIRYMFKPTLDNYSQHCYDPATTPTFEVHGGSGIANSFFYLLAEGAVVPAGFGAGSWANLSASSLVCNGNTALTGIGRDAAGKIWYRALTVYMTSGTNYAGARAATISAATDLYGGTSAQTNAVKAAWSAVNVN